MVFPSAFQRVTAENVSYSGGCESFLEFGLEELGGVIASLLDLCFQRQTCRHQFLNSLQDRSLLGKRWDGDDDTTAARLEVRWRYRRKL
jgi:hypothetical protein